MLGIRAAKDGGWLNTIGIRAVVSRQVVNKIFDVDYKW